MPTPSDAKNYEEEQEYWAAKLRIDELEFANLYLNKAVNGYTSMQCYKLSHPNANGNAKTLQTCADRTVKAWNVAGYIQAMRQETVSESIMGLDELKEDLTIQVRGYDHLFEGVVYWEDTPTGRIAFVDSLGDVPEPLRKYVNGHQYHSESEGYELFLRQYPGKEADKNKARQLLAQMQGGLIDRKDINLGGAIVAEKIDAEMTDEDAAAVYKRVMRKE